MWNKHTTNYRSFKHGTMWKHSKIKPGEIEYLIQPNRTAVTSSNPWFRCTPHIYTENVMMSHSSIHAAEYDVTHDIGGCTAVLHCGTLPDLLNTWPSTTVRLQQSEVNGQNNFMAIHYMTLSPSYFGAPSLHYPWL